VNIRYNLQEELAKKQIEMEEIDLDIARRESLVESYNNETDQQIKNNLDLTSLDTAYEIPDKSVSVNNLEVSIDVGIGPTAKGTYSFQNIVKTFDSRSIKTFTILGSPREKLVLFNNATIDTSTVYKLGAVITFKYLGQDVISKYFTINQFNKELILDSYYLVDSFEIRGTFDVLITLPIYPSLKFNSVVLHSFEAVIEAKSWTTFVERQNYLKNELLIKKNQKQLEIDLIETGPQYIIEGFDETQEIDESNTYGIQQLEQRLDYVRNFTAIDYDSLSESAKTELKRVRRGKVYENTDIVDSKNLFEASETFLSENINPLITVSIESISILQAYEAQSD
jgi:hypothetical protein